MPRNCEEDWGYDRDGRIVTGPMSSPRKWLVDFVDLGDADMRNALRDNQKALAGS